MVGNGSSINYEHPVIWLLLIDGNIVGGKPICIMYGVPQGSQRREGSESSCNYTLRHRTDKGIFFSSCLEGWTQGAETMATPVAARK
jgi:hypothetical protein